MKCLPLFRLALAPVISVIGVSSLVAQTTRVADTDSGQKITSLTQDHRPRRAAAALGTIDASSGGEINSSVLEAPASEDSVTLNGMQAGKGAGHAGHPGSSLPVSSGMAASNGLQRGTGWQGAYGSQESSGSQGTNGWQGVVYGSQQRAGLPASSQSLSLSSRAPASSVSPSSPGQSSTSIEKPATDDLAKAYILPDASPMPVRGRRSFSSGTHAGVNLSRSVESRPAVTSSSYSSADRSGDESASPAGDSSSLTDQTGSTSDEAQQGFFEVLSDPFESPFNTRFENPSGSPEFARICGDACRFGKGGPSTTFAGFKSSKSDESDRDDSVSGSDWRSSLVRSQHAGNSREGWVAARKPGSHKRSDSHETWFRSRK